MKFFFFSKRKSAEIVSFVTSIIIISGILIVLIFRSFDKNEGPYISFGGSALIEEVVQKEKYYIVPIVIENNGHKTPVFSRFKVDFSFPDNKESFEIDLQYLDRYSSKKVFVKLLRNPKDAKIEVKPLYYFFE